MTNNKVRTDFEFTVMYFLIKPSFAGLKQTIRKVLRSAPATLAPYKSFTGKKKIKALKQIELSLLNKTK